MALLDYVQSLANYCGVASLDGIPPHEWYEKKRQERLQQFMIKHEDLDPAAAALIQQEIDKSRKPPK